MITPFEIYLILQLDSLRDMFQGFAVLLGILSAISCIVYTITHGIGSGDDGDRDARAFSLALKPIMKALLWAFFPCCLLANGLPSTKTAAAMFIVPAIVNNQTIQKEAGELYNLAKQALTEAVRGDEPKPETTSEKK